jgi:integrase
MATIRKRNKKYQVQIRKLGQKINKTFYKLDDAKRWSIFYENKINLNGEVERLDTKLKLSELLDRYLNEITPVKKGSEREVQRIKRLKKEDISNKRVCILKTKDFVEFKQKRMLNGNRTCRYDLAILHHLYNVAIKQWNYPISFNPVSNVPKPRCNPPRERRLSDSELKYILNEDFKNPHIKNIISIAIETGMRRGEILSIRPQNLTKSFLWIPDSKNGCSRKIPLNFKVKRILQNSTLPFPISVNALKLSWNRMLKRSGIKDLHFHDLRHEAISRFFEKGLSIPEVSMISGHKDIRQLMRYTHLKIEDIAKKI